MKKKLQDLHRSGKMTAVTGLRPGEYKVPNSRMELHT
jgi:hypothetical protein